MPSFKSSYARLARMFEQSRDHWRDKAKERHKRIRALEVKVRDLEKSRPHWKNRALGRAHAETARPNEVSKDTSEHDVVKVEDGHSVPHNHHDSLLTIRLSIELQLAYISLRGTCRVLKLG